MFSLRICRYSSDAALTIEILKVVENLLKQRVSKKPWDRAFDEKSCSGGRDSTNLENLLWGMGW